MKPIIEILSDTIGVSVEKIEKYRNNTYGSVSLADALEAMKSAMKQAYIDGNNKGFLGNRMRPEEYLKILEEQK